MILGNNKDKFGYYQVGTFKTYSKVEAIELHRITGIHPHWDFNESYFRNYNWKFEPTETLDELYARRAAQIRNDYDYVVLFYSGGADSDNILDTFVKNNIKIDEVVTYNYQSIDSDPTSYFNSELAQVAWPKLKTLQDQGVNFIYRNIDLSSVALELLTDEKFLLNRGYYASLHWGTSHLARSYIRERTPDYKKIIESGKKLVFVWGSDKPRLYKENNRYCIKFLDLVDSAINCRTQLINRQEEYDELFYWAPESADIVCKQGHVLKRFFEKFSIDNINNLDMSSNDKVKLKIPDLETTFANKNASDHMSHRNLVNTIIYSNFNPATFSVGKPGSVLLSPRETKFHSDTELKRQTDRLLDHIKGLDEYWLSNPLNFYKGIKLCVSPAYYLE